MSKVYKIRDKKTGLFSRGGTRVSYLWSKQGKAWSNIGHIKNHLIQFYSHSVAKENPYANAEIIEIDIDYDKSPKFDVSVLYDGIEQKQKFDKKRAEELTKEYREKAERKTLEELKKKYEELH